MNNSTQKSIDALLRGRANILAHSAVSSLSEDELYYLEYLRCRTEAQGCSFSIIMLSVYAALLASIIWLAIMGDYMASGILFVFYIVQRLFLSAPLTQLIASTKKPLLALLLILFYFSVYISCATLLPDKLLLPLLPALYSLLIDPVTLIHSNSETNPALLNKLMKTHEFNELEARIQWYVLKGFSVYLIPLALIVIVTLAYLL